ncbi:MAG: O-antigen ligase family protein [Candidatus Limnocylindria bacterium]
MALKIAGLILVFDPGGAQAFDLPKSLFSRATAWLLLALILVALLRYGHRIVPRTSVHVFVGAFLLANVLALGFAQDRYIALFGDQRFLGLTFILDMVVLYLAVALAYRTREDWSILGVAVAACALITVAYAIVQYAGRDPYPWVDDLRHRPFSTFGNPNKYGHFLGAMFGAAVGLAVVARGPRARRVRLLAGLSALALLATAAVVATRGTLLGMGCALLAAAAVHVRLSGLARRASVSTAGWALGAIALMGLIVVATPLGQRLGAGLADAATQQRVLVADAALRAFLDRPLTGYGPDNFAVLYPRYRQSGIAAAGLVNQNSAHNWLLQAAATTGLPGALSLAGLVGASLLALWKGLVPSPHVAAPLLVGAVAYWTHGFVTVGSVSVDWLGWVAAAGSATFGRYPAAVGARRVASGVQATVAAVALVLALSGYSALQANREAHQAGAARAAGQLDLAIAPAERAVRLDPGRSEYWRSLGLSREAREMWREAAEAFRAATERAPHRAANWERLAVSLANLALAGDESLGGREAALAAARGCVAADPNSPGPYQVLAVIANGLGDHDVALEAAGNAIRLYKGQPEYEAVAADAALRSADPRAARAALERLVEEQDAAVLRVALARLSLKLNDGEAARSHLRRALELDPESAPARELMRQMGL